MESYWYFFKNLRGSFVLFRDITEISWVLLWASNTTSLVLYFTKFSFGRLFSNTKSIKLPTNPGHLQKIIECRIYWKMGKTGEGGISLSRRQKKNNQNLSLLEEDLIFILYTFWTSRNAMRIQMLIEMHAIVFK